jgi:hypothetical protein
MVQNKNLVTSRGLDMAAGQPIFDNIKRIREFDPRATSGPANKIRIHHGMTIGVGNDGRCVALGKHRNKINVELFALD